MKRWILLFAATVAIGLFMKVEPTGTDVAALEPVELLYVGREMGEYVVATDTGQQGRGRTVASAIKNMKEGAAKELFLETAEHLLVSADAKESVFRLFRYLRPDCSLTVAQGQPDMENAPGYLDTHSPGMTLNDFRAGETHLPVLYFEEGGMRLEKS